jgi:(S)-2-hydroxyglutarate dehydrogenase
MNPHTDARADFVVVGGGIVGLAIALETKRRHPDCSVLVLEKEHDVGLHASGRNSGVLHAGFYYAADSLKARLTAQGRARLVEFCNEHDVPVRRCGKLVVARDATELATMDELYRRGVRNGVRLEVIDADDARRIEPRVHTHERALWSPDTGAVDPATVMRAFATAAERAGVRIRTGVAYHSATVQQSGVTIRTSAGDVHTGYLINAAGLYADRIAHPLGFGRRYRILPFKGVYLYDARPDTLRTHVYPVPDLGYPWLGVHFTVTAAGRTKIGPTAIPAFWREHYRGLANFSARELLEIVGQEAGHFLRNDFAFRTLAARELPKYFRRALVARAATLVPDTRLADYREWGTPGIRAQLVDIETRRLEMDFKLEGDETSFHVLNAVSPAFTCSLAFAELVGDEVAKAGG